MADREDIERRLLALVRHWMDEEEEANPQGWDVTDLTVLFEVHRAPAADYEFQPWDRNGAWRKDVGWATTCTGYWAQKAILEGVLEEWQEQYATREQPEEEEDEEET